MKRDRRREDGDDRVEQVVADQDHAEQQVGAREQALRRFRAERALADEMLQPMAVERHHGGLGDGKEAGTEEKQEDGADLRP